jgi:hypothetical protein
VILFQMSRTVLALMPYSAPTVLDRALSEILPRVARASGGSMEGRIEKICQQHRQDLNMQECGADLHWLGAHILCLGGSQDDLACFLAGQRARCCWI